MTNQRNAIELDEAARRVRLPQGMRIDLGGIGKGWIAQQAAQRLAGYSEACAVNAGGDLCALGLEAFGRVAMPFFGRGDFGAQVRFGLFGARAADRAEQSALCQPFAAHGRFATGVAAGGRDDRFAFHCGFC